MSTAKSIIISCAGIGSRLGLGQTKALVKIDGKSIIHRQLELFKDVEDVRIVIGYQGNDIVNEVLGIRKDVTFVYNHDYFNTKTGASYYLGARHANSLCVEWDGDLLVHPDDVANLLKLEEEYICYSEITSDEAVFLKLNDKGEVIGFSRENGDFEWTGPACLKKENLKFTKGNVFEQLEPNLPIKGIKVRAFDIDTFEDYKRAIECYKEWSKE